LVARAGVFTGKRSRATYVFSFHDEGLFTFYCTMHQPEMTGQILVLPRRSG